MAALSALEALVPSRARRALLGALYSMGEPQSVSALARAARLTPRAVAQQVERLERAGLVTGVASGPSRLLQANLAHPAARALQALVAAAPLPVGADDLAARRVLAAHGAPMAGVEQILAPPSRRRYSSAWPGCGVTRGSFESCPSCWRDM